MIKVKIKPGQDELLFHFIMNIFRNTFFKKYFISVKSTGTGLGTYSAALMAKTLGAIIDLKTSDFLSLMKYPGIILLYSFLYLSE